MGHFAAHQRLTAAAVSTGGWPCRGLPRSGALLTRAFPLVRALGPSWAPWDSQAPAESLAYDRPSRSSPAGGGPCATHGTLMASSATENAEIRRCLTAPSRAHYDKGLPEQLIIPLYEWNDCTHDCGADHWRGWGGVFWLPMRSLAAWRQMSGISGVRVSARQMPGRIQDARPLNFERKLGHTHTTNASSAPKAGITYRNFDRSTSLQQQGWGLARGKGQTAASRASTGLQTRRTSCGTP